MVFNQSWIDHISRPPVFPPTSHGIYWHCLLTADALTLVTVVGGKSDLGVILIVGAIRPLLLTCPCRLYDCWLYIWEYQPRQGTGVNSAGYYPHGRIQLPVNE